jgi:hypothetical protein
MKGAQTQETQSAAQTIDGYVAGKGGWRAALLTRLRRLIAEAEPGLEEDWKWGTPIWRGKGNVVALTAFSDHIKLNFFRGASLEDPHGLFNAGLDAKATRAIDVQEGEDIKEPALTTLLQAAAALDRAGAK